MPLTAQQLVAIAGRCPRPDALAPMLWAAMERNGIVTVTRAAAFLGQLAHESAEFCHTEEEGTGQIYEGRMSLGNTDPGDGPRYKGRGFIQLTGRYNYTQAGFENHPEKVAEPENAVLVSTWYWNLHRLNEKADVLDFVGITRAINGGLNGWDDRLWYYRQALQVLGIHAPLA